MTITEEQKKLIESTGHYVIEFKLWFKKAKSVMIDIMDAIAQWIVGVIKCVVRIVTDVADSICGCILDMVKNTDKYVKITNKYPKRDIKVPKLRYYISYKTIYHCRNNC